MNSKQRRQHKRATDRVIDSAIDRAAERFGFNNPPTPDPVKAAQKSAIETKSVLKPPRAFSWAGKALVALSVIAGLTVFLARIEVEASRDGTINDPFDATFIVKNTSVFPLTDVMFMVGMCNVLYERFDVRGLTKMGPEECAKQPRSVLLVTQNWERHRLGTDDRYEITLRDGVEIDRPEPFQSADISIVVFYKPWRLPVERKREFRFVSKINGDGSVSWLHQLIDAS